MYRKGMIMTAARLNIRWTDLDGLEQESMVVVIRHIAQDQQYGWCPECNAIIQTWRAKLCGICGEEVPQELLFAVRAASHIKELLRTEEQRHRAWMNSWPGVLVTGSESAHRLRRCNEEELR